MQPDEQERQDAGDHPSSCIEQSPPVQDTADAVHGADHDSSKTNKVGDVHGPGDWQEAQETDRLQSKEPSGPGLESGNVQNGKLRCNLANLRTNTKRIIVCVCSHKRNIYDL